MSQLSFKLQYLAPVSFLAETDLVFDIIRSRR